MKKLWRWGVFMLAVVNACTAAETPALPQVSLGSEGINLQRWLLLGSFVADPGVAAIDVDFLAPLGRAEAVCGAKDILEWSARMPSVNVKGRVGARVVDGADEVDFGILYDSQPPKGSKLPQTAVYAFCEINTETEANAWLLLASDDGAKVWLNGRLVHESREVRGIREGDDAIGLPLRRGVNFLVIKIANIDRGWLVRARLEPDAFTAAHTAWERQGNPLKKTFFLEGTPLEFRRGFPAALEQDATVESFDQTITRKVRVGPGSESKMTGLPRGLYRLTLKLGGRNYTQTFYLGDVSTVHPDLARKCKNLMVDPHLAINLGAWLRWLDVLSRPPKLDPTYTVWDNAILAGDRETKVFFAATRIHEALARIRHGEEPFRNQPGMHLRGVHSPVDDQVLNYRLFVPSNYRANDGAGLALVIIAQTVFTRRVPYLESLYAASLKEAQDWAQVAEKLGVGILWPGYRISPYGNPADLAQFDEVLANVAEDFRLDPGRLYLFGFCSGGLTASMEAVRHPQRYAGIAYLNPVLHRLKNRFDDDGVFDGWPAYRSWLQSTDPVASLAGVPNLPVWIIHDGVDVDHGPLSHSVDFVELARAVGNRPRFERNRNQNPAPTRTAVFQRQLAWLVQQRRTDPAPLIFTEGGDLGGPLSRAFAERFVLVEATGGGANDRTANRKLSVEFQDAWLRTNYGPCRVVEDRAVTAEEEKNSHLVLLGSPETNLVWQRLSSRLPITAGASRIDVGGRTYDGENLAFQAWFQHPDHHGKRIVLIGSAHASQATFGTLELALDGWFDYSIWRTEGAKSTMIAAERFPMP